MIQREDIALIIAGVVAIVTLLAGHPAGTALTPTEIAILTTALGTIAKGLIPFQTTATVATPPTPPPALPQTLKLNPDGKTYSPA